MDEHEDDPPSASVEAPASPSAAIPLMITRRQRAALRGRGIMDEAIALMTPAEAHEILRSEPKPG